MKETIKTVLMALGVVLVSACVMVALFWSKRTVWPEFPATKSNAPQVVVSVRPDFAYRTGDVIPITIFVLSKPHTTLDVGSLSIQGDFEVVGGAAPQVFVRDTKTGAQYVRLDARVQSFAVKHKWTLVARLYYHEEASQDDRAASSPVLSLYTSPTWDGRDQLKDGPMTPVGGWHWLVTVLALVFGLVGIILCRKYILSVDELVQVNTIPSTPRQAAWHDFQEVWQRIKAGDEDAENFKEIRRIVACLYHIESRTVDEIPSEIGESHPHKAEILVVIGLCEKVLYKGARLTSGEIELLEPTMASITKPNE